MYRVRQQDLPFRGSSHHFVGASNGDVNVSVFLFRGLPGAGPGPHRHPYDEVQFVQEGRANGSSTERNSKRGLATSSSSRPARSIAFAASERHRWFNSTSI